MSTPEIEELERRRRLARRMGGEENVARQHAQGRLTARERIDALCDPGSFRERGILSGVATYDEAAPERIEDFTPCPFIMGVGKIEGRRVAIQADRTGEV